MRWCIRHKSLKIKTAYSVIREMVEAGRLTAETVNIVMHVMEETMEETVPGMVKGGSGIARTRLIG